MPVPELALLQDLSAKHFRSLNIALPMSYAPPRTREERAQHAQAFDSADLSNHSPKPDSLFQAATTSKIHAESVDTVSGLIRTYMDGICAAIVSAWRRWHGACVLNAVVVNGPVASGGVLKGPALKAMILAEAPRSTPAEVRYSEAIASAVDAAMSAWSASVKVPGLPWYPAFAAFPGPVAPPTPNVPCPVAALAHVGTPMSQASLKAAMVSALADEGAQHHAALFESIAAGLSQCFEIWLTTTQVTQVLASGSVPTYAPPAVLAGPVVNGSGAMAPGGLA